MVLWEPPWGRALGDSVWRRTPFFSVSLSPSSFLPGLVVPHAHPWETALGLRAFAGKYLGLHLAAPLPPFLPSPATPPGGPPLSQLHGLSDSPLHSASISLSWRAYHRTPGWISPGAAKMCLKSQ